MRITDDSYLRSLKFAIESSYENITLHANVIKICSLSISLYVLFIALEKYCKRNERKTVDSFNTRAILARFRTLKINIFLLYRLIKCSKLISLIVSVLLLHKTLHDVIVTGENRCAQLTFRCEIEVFISHGRLTY